MWAIIRHESNVHFPVAAPIQFPAYENEFTHFNNQSAIPKTKPKSPRARRVI